MKQMSLIKKRKRTRGKKWGRPVTTHTGARRKREEFFRPSPLHITVRIREGLPNLRSRKGAQIVKHAILGAQLCGLRIIHFAILSNHIHLIAEADSCTTLYRSMKSFCSRVGIRLRRWAKDSHVKSLDQRGLGLFRGRYHMERLKTPQQVKQALKYVLLNPARNFKKSAYIDAFTSAASFGDWKTLLGRNLTLPKTGVTLKQRLKEFLSPPGLWLTQSGWMRARSL